MDSRKALAAWTMVIGVALGRLYGLFSDWNFNLLPMGQPGYEYEIWLVNALLSVTFPFLIFYAAYFEYWPLIRLRASRYGGQAGEPAPAATKPLAART